MASQLAIAAWTPVAAPLVAAVDDRWRREDDLVQRLALPNMAVFAAVQVLGTVERRRRWFRRGWWLRRAR